VWQGALVRRSVNGPTVYHLETDLALARCAMLVAGRGQYVAPMGIAHGLMAELMVKRKPTADGGVGSILWLMSLAPEPVEAIGIVVNMMMMMVMMMMMMMMMMMS
jgi:hypothetical protein